MPGAYNVLNCSNGCRQLSQIRIEPATAGLEPQA